MKNLLNSIQRKKAKYIILLDLDGVINIFGMDFERELTIIRNGANVWRVPSETIEFIKELSQREDVEIYWLSSWQEEANILNKNIGIKDFKTTDSIHKSNNLSINNIKLNQIDYFKQRFEDSIVISIDDDLKETNADFHICPDSKVGLTKKEFNIILNLLNERNKIK